MRHVPRLMVILLAATACSTPGFRGPGEAVSDTCRLPAEITPPAIEAVAPADVVVAPATYHMLALTWSPQWCAANGDKPSEKLQCADNRFGWVLHGLWPNADAAPHPRFCRTPTPVPVATIRRHLCQTPSPDLIQHEWTAHGACAWDDPETYFADAGALWDNLKRPDPADLAGASGRLSAGSLRTAFVRSNPGLPRDAVAIGVTSTNALREVRLCHDLALRPRPCPADARGAPDDLVMTVVPIPTGPGR